MKVEKILILSPHCDDSELSCGGTIARFLEEGKEVYVVAFATAQATKEEYFNSMISLGVENPQLYDFPFRRFNEKRQEILDALIKIRKDINPDIVFLPSEYDTHQDHEVIYQEGFRAFKKSSILGCQGAWNQKRVDLNFFIPLEERHIDRKIRALENYKSQSEKFYCSADYIKGESKHWGSHIGVPCAEIFQIINWIL